MSSIRTIGSALVFLVAAATARGQAPVIEGSTFRLGAVAGYARNLHDTRTNVVTGGAECGAFGNGSGDGYTIGLVGSFPIVGRWLDLAAGLALAERGGSFGEATVGGLPILDPNTNTYTELVRQHNYAANLRTALVELGVRLTPMEHIPAYARAMLAVAVPLSPTFEQTEEIARPGGVVFPETGSSLRTAAAGEIAGTSPFGAVGILAGYELPLGRRLRAAPEVGVYLPLTDVTGDARWRVTTLQAGVVVSWMFGGRESTPAPLAEAAPVPLPPPPSAPPPPTAALEVDGRLAVTETIVTETFPVLPYLFFEAGSARLPSRYIALDAEGVAAFREDSLPRRSLSTYHHVLNVIGARMRGSSSGIITLTATSDPDEPTRGGTVEQLARARAEAIRAYLVDAWGISGERIRVRTTAQPTFPTSTEYREGVEENRRVEITTTSDEILRPIVFRRFREYTIEPKRSDLTATYDGDVDRWELVVDHDGTPLWSAAGEGAPPDRITWEPDPAVVERVGTAIDERDSLRWVLRVTGEGGVTESARMLPAERRLHPFEVSRLSLIVFDFDRADITEQNRRMVSSFVAGSIGDSSSAVITGSTDRLGELKHNRRLSAARAVGVRQLILAERPDTRITRTEGIGPTRLLYDNDLPEGRFYCRTVSVEVETPVGGEEKG